MASPGEVIEISPAELRSGIFEGQQIHLLDTRNKAEFDAWHIEGPTITHHNIPAYKFLSGEPAPDVLEPLPENEPITVVCAIGESSATVAETLAASGYATFHLTGGMEAWANHFESYRLQRPDTLEIHQCIRPSSGCLSYLVIEEASAVVIDPIARFNDEYRSLAEARNASIEAAVDSHIHADHISGLRTLAETTGAVPYLPVGAIERGITFEEEVTPIDDGETIPLASNTLKAFSTPGHTSGMTSFRVADIVFSGDSLFLDGVARPDLEYGEEGAEQAARELYWTLQDRLLTLPEETTIAPGHARPEELTKAQPACDTIGAIRRRLPVLDFDEGTFVEQILADMPPHPDNFQTIIEINLGRQAIEEKDFQLELGPNNCATAPPKASNN